MRLLAVALLLLGTCHGWHYVFGRGKSSNTRSSTPATKPSAPAPASSSDSVKSSNPVPIPRSGSRGSIINSPNSPTNGTPLGYQTSNPMTIKPGLKRQGSTASVQRYSFEYNIGGSHQDASGDPLRGVPGSNNSSASPRFFSDASVELRKYGYPVIGPRDIEAHLSAPSYIVDKSLFIRRVMEDDSPLVGFYVPRLMGKSFNLSLLARFLDARYDPSAGFKRLLAINYHENVGFVKGFAGKYNVIWMDWAKSGVLAASSIEDLEARMTRYLTGLFKETLEGVGKTLRDINGLIEADIDIELTASARSIWECSRMLGSLVKVLAEACSQPETIILIDDVDRVLIKAAELGHYQEMSDFLAGLYETAAEMGEGSLHKMIAMGTHQLVGQVPFGKVRLARSGFKYSYFGISDKYEGDFGFTEAEVGSMLAEFRSPLTIDELEKWYSIPNRDQQQVIFHPYSTAAAIRYNRLDRYWTKDCPLRTDKFPFSRLVNWGPGDMHLLAQMPSDPSFKWPMSHVFTDLASDTVDQVILLNWLAEEGYIQRYGQSYSDENRHAMEWVKNSWLDRKTGLIRAIHAIKETADTEALRTAINSLFTVNPFLSNKPASAHTHLGKFLNDCFSSVLPICNLFMHEGHGAPVARLSDHQQMTVFIKLERQARSEFAYLADRVKHSKALDFYSDMKLLYVWLDSSGNVAVQLGDIYTRTIYNK